MVGNGRNGWRWDWECHDLMVWLGELLLWQDFVGGKAERDIILGNGPGRRFLQEAVRGGLPSLLSATLVLIISEA